MEYPRQLSGIQTLRPLVILSINILNNRNSNDNLKKWICKVERSVMKRGISTTANVTQNRIRLLVDC